MRTRCAILLAFGLLLLLPATALASPVLPQPVVLSQPDGSGVPAMPYGDEWNNGYESLDGYTVVQDTASGEWQYAVADDQGKLKPSGKVPGRHVPPGQTKHLRDNTAVAPENALPAVAPNSAGLEVIGSRPLLILLASFSNQGSVGTTPADWYNRFFGPSGSVAAFYQEASYGKLAVTPVQDTSGTANDGIVGWLNLGYAHPNTGGSVGDANRQIVRNAIIAANAYVNFAAYDSNHDGYLADSELSIVVVVAGYETAYGGTGSACQPNVWAHRWSLYSSVAGPSVDGVIVGQSPYGGYFEMGEWHCMSNDNPGHAGTMGTAAHELGHNLGWPDLYDTDNSSEGVGRWSLMGSGNWNSAGGLQGSSPAHPDAWSKWKQGWVTPRQIGGAESGAVLAQVETNASVLQMLSNPGGVNWNGSSGTGEYFLLENRQKVGFDAGLPGCGILIWHIDESRPDNATDTRRLVDLEEADGRNDMDSKANRGDASDPYPGSSNRQAFNATSSPNSNLYSGAASTVSAGSFSACASSMTANLSVGGVAPTPTNTPVSPTPTNTPTHTATATPSPGALTITGVRFSPASLPSGNLLLVEVGVRNDTGATALTQNPPPGFTYNEGDTPDSRGYNDVAGRWRVGVEFAARPGAVKDHPYRWGLGADLANGQSVTVTGYIKLTTVRTTSYWAGLVQEGMKWWQDGSNPTGITVTSVAATPTPTRTATPTRTPTPSGSLQITGVRFSPATLASGQVMQVDIGVRNGSNVVALSEGPPPGFTYNEGDTSASRGYPDIAGRWRVGIDFNGRTGMDHPYRWGLGADLAPGAAVTVTGYIKLTTARTTNYWAGLVQEGVAWRQNGIGVTSITVTPAGSPARLTVTGVRFSPTTLASGQTLQVDVTVRNDGGSPAQTQGPNPGFIYNEGDTMISRGFGEVANAWRVGIDFAGRPGSIIDHPYRWGLGAPLAPGASATVTGYIRLTTPGAKNYWAGAVQEAIRWQQDNAGTTTIMVN